MHWVRIIGLLGLATISLLNAKEGEHWAFTPPQRFDPPAVKQSDWPRNAVDHFILSQLESRNLKPSTEASRAQLLRRVYLDLIGLPPTLEEVEAYLADPRPDRWSRRVELAPT